MRHTYLACEGAHDAAVLGAIYLNALDRDQLTSEERTNLERGANLKKAHVATIGAVLSPGYSTPVTLRENRWIDAGTLEDELLKPLHHFVCALIRS